ncbi:heavy-metal-associated domain-containing protein [Leucobacter insecticola]|uniref:Heavy-metal-associated domain-containing protein n=1 Tax=Leucobacter insecticola TaxID=2714934 RepID=A0A6G8FGZ3_9MICO|nr:heavy metal-associated domain-containing protein [Leucobacter insecticola]QIM15625.1 heavy-metal-associated domain-containing protein [Leucobacter insecticola]
MSTTITSNFLVTGMTCSHCENAIREEVSQIPGVTDIEVSAETGLLRVTQSAGSAPDAADIIAAVDEAGYEAALQGA